MKKILFALILITVIFSLSALSAFAINESEDASVNESESSSLSEENADGVINEEGENSTNVFDTIFNAIVEHSGEIFSAIAAVLSGMVIFVYKKGIVPLLRGGLSAIGSGVESLEASTKQQSDNASSISAAVNEGLSSARELLSSLTQSIGQIEERLLKTESDSVDRKCVFGVIYSQLEMLYEIFMSSSLPSYEKERVGEQISKMKANLPRIEGVTNEA